MTKRFIMEFFKKFVSNTLAGTGSQTWFSLSKGEKRTSRVYYKLFEGGSFDYSFLFSNTLSSTFADGSVSRRNFLCDEWEILSMKVAIATMLPSKNANGCEKLDFLPVTFDSKTQKKVCPGELFYSDPVTLVGKKGDYLCIETTFCSNDERAKLPYHEEIQIPVYLLDGNEWTAGKQFPVPCMVGCDRPVKKSVAFLGDSITQGIGVPPNSYLHYTALTAELLGCEYAFWNLGLGYARADDMATLGAWFYQAKQADVACVCYGVNDVNRGFDAQTLKANLTKIVVALKASGVKILVQTIPPFDYNEQRTSVWKETNEYILNELSLLADGVFDVAPLLGKEDEPQMAKFVGHPNAEGCALWAKNLAPALLKLLK